VDWSAIKTEYITDESTSYRKLAEKYGVSYTSIGARARKEGWAEERERFLNKTLSKTLNAIGKKQAKRASRLQMVTEKLLTKIEAAVDDFDMRDLFTDRTALRQITGALKDIKDIQMIKSEADLREQEARIRNLERQAEGDDRDLNAVTVTIEGGDDSWRQ
jgi:uncharacterized protein YjcR